MGVPGYFSRAVRFAPKSVSPAQRRSCAALYVDFNCLVHRQVLGAGAKQTAQDVIDRALEYFELELMPSCALAPGARVFVAADGPPPLSKMMQQRGRRFIARYKCPLTASAPHTSPARRDRSSHDDPFERSDITPGTPFAARLDAASARLCERLTASRAHGAAEYLYSGTNEPGEGEQKIMSEMRIARSRAAGIGPDVSSAPQPHVYGLDADLLLLTMLHGARTGDWPTVVREADELGGKSKKCPGAAAFSFVDIKQVTAVLAGGVDPRRVRNHVVCSFLCGNDFLPPASCLSVHDGWMGHLKTLSEDLDLAPEAPQRGPPGSPAGGLLVDPAEMGKLLDRLARQEDADFFRADRRYWEAVAPRPRDPEDAWNSYPLLNKDRSLRAIRPGTGGWRSRFYGKVMGIRHHEDVANACYTYLAGVAWCAAYYSGGLGRPGDEPSWFYPYHYGPTTMDLANALAGDGGCGSNRAMRVPGAEDGFPTLRFAPETVRNFVVPPPPGSARLSYLFPTSFRLGTYLRHKVWHCPAELPFPLDVTRDVMNLKF